MFKKALSIKNKIKNLIKNKVTSILFILLLALAVPTTSSLAVDSIDENWCDGSFASICFDNPFGSNEPQTLKALILMILDIIIFVAIPIIVLGFVYSGFLFFSGQGKDEDLGKAKRVLIYSIIGAVIILSAKGIYGLVDATGRNILDINI